MAKLKNTFDAGVEGTAITSANSGGGSGDAFTTVSLGAGAAFAFRAAAAYRGPMGGRLTLGSTSSYARWTRLETANRCVMRMPLKIPTGTTIGAQQIVMSMWGEAGGNAANLSLRTNRTLRISPSGVDFVASDSPALVFDTRYWCEMAVTRSTGTADGVCEIRITHDDGSVFHAYTASAVVTTTNQLAQYRFGQAVAQTGWTTMDLDELQADGLASGWLGALSDSAPVLLERDYLYYDPAAAAGAGAWV